MRVLINTVIIIFLSANLYLPSHSQNLSPETIKLYKAATVYIEVEHSFPLINDVVRTSGTGFFISKYGYIITCNHVIESGVSAEGSIYPTIISKIKVITNSGTDKHKTYNAKLLKTDSKNDVALLYIMGVNNCSYIEPDYSGDLIESTPVWTFGFPLSDEFSVIQRGPEITITTGNITALRHNDVGHLEKIQLDAVVKHGNSGGPLINSNGKVIGIINLAYGESRFNFAVPASFINNVIEGIDINVSPDSEVNVSINSTPEGASIYSGNKFLGYTPLQSIKLDKQLHQLIAMKNGFEPWIENVTPYNGEIIDIILNPVKDIKVITTGKEYGLVPQVPEYEITGQYLYEEFNSQERFEKWEQNTGGYDKRTWFIEDDILNQYESDELLHAISIGESTWNNYLIKAKVRIINEQNDSRAGIIFNETKNGFYLFRIHKETDKAQLAYHCKNPFGWFVIAEKRLDTDITDEWFNLKIINADSIIACFFNEECIFTAIARYSLSGNTGFYSVESKASFDSLFVEKIKLRDQNNLNDIFKDKLVSFWFSDYFTTKPTNWYMYKNDMETPEPWFSSEAGSAQFEKDEAIRNMELTKYRFLNCEIWLVITLDQAEKESVFELFFRKNENGSLVLKFSKDGNKVELIENKNNKTKVLKKEDLPLSFFGEAVLLHLKLNDKYLSLEVTDESVLRYYELPESSGRFGFSTKQLRLILHQLTINSIAGK